MFLISPLDSREEERVEQPQAQQGGGVLQFEQRTRKREREDLRPKLQPQKGANLVALLGPEGFVRLLTKTALGLLQKNEIRRARELLSTVQNPHLSESFWMPFLVLSARAAYLDGDFFSAAESLRKVLQMKIDNIAAWNLLNRTIARMPELVYTLRFNFAVKKLATQSLPYVNLFLGNTTTRRWLAIKRYLRVFADCGHSPLLDLSIGLTYIALSTSRTNPNTLATILNAFAWLTHYANTRDDKAEVHYNLGRAFHQVGLSHLAIPHYQTVLSLPPSNFTREAAFNLSLIYRGSGALHLAREILRGFVRF